MKVKMLVVQTCLTVCDPVDYSLLGSAVLGTSQAGILEWIAIPSSTDLLRDLTWVFCTAGRFFTV